ncbi:MAG: DUF4380 domain-containing protein [Candidatus Brocadiae bacterium]|nr:DUF4380 domain-containing protein [Candidatus Brocadiia bacterium]
MRSPELFVGFCLLSLAILPLASGCAGSRERAVHSTGPVTISRMNFRGWRNSYRLTNGQVELIVVPQIARIMKYSLVGGENLLWVNDEMTPDATGQQFPPPDPKKWANFGGYKLWMAPEQEKGWPPDWQLDRGPCRAPYTGDGSLHLIGMASQKHGIRFDRKITLAPHGTRVEIEQTMINVSKGPVSGAIWEVTQVKADCLAFVPMGPGATYRVSKTEDLDDQWSRADDMLLLRPSGKPNKVFISGPPGWLGCQRGEVLYLKSFDFPQEPTPETEAPREVYTSNLGYIELEVVAPAVTLEPGQRTTFNETWQLAPAVAAATDRSLVASIRARVEQLLQR